MWKIYLLNYSKADKPGTGLSIQRQWCRCLMRWMCLMLPSTDKCEVWQLQICLSVTQRIRQRATYCEITLMAVLQVLEELFRCFWFWLCPCFEHDFHFASEVFLGSFLLGFLKRRASSSSLDSRLASCFQNICKNVEHFLWQIQNHAGHLTTLLGQPSVKFQVLKKQEEYWSGQSRLSSTQQRWTQDWAGSCTYKQRFARQTGQVNNEVGQISAGKSITQNPLVGSNGGQLALFSGTKRETFLFQQPESEPQCICSPVNSSSSDTIVSHRLETQN